MFAYAERSLVRLRGSYATCKKFEEEIGVKKGQVSEDGKFSIEFMECLADCGRTCCHGG